MNEVVLTEFPTINNHFLTATLIIVFYENIFLNQHNISIKSRVVTHPPTHPLHRQHKNEICVYTL